ncbi:hypothetical protein CSR02_04380 [Acetobacter pomorum]|uniref:Cysteine-rich CWC family protein n=1 Tax=Acetobacter pomorum TaxID=65959 RepID=A0A2G4RE58_9PROT|nr:hypothetical protein CSR02_04380 [Acetobacter pomorum]
MTRCKKCDTEFPCQPDGACWCMEKPRGLPVPTDDYAGCLCPNCLEGVSKEYADRNKAELSCNG